MTPQATKQRLERLAWWTDEAIRLPGGYRIGLDGIIGLIPGVGDVAGGLVSSYIVLEARHAGVPRRKLFKMVWNILLELVIGSIPIIGDLFDFMFKANKRNVELLHKSLEQQEQEARPDD